MSVPDQSHINRVRDALWQRSVGGASVMIGSGFSRNALPDAYDPPTWREVARAVYDKLYPQGGDDDQGTAKSDFLRLAQEYEAAFGRSDLHRFLRELIRDDDFLPGDLHIRLLSLPWRRRLHHELGHFFGEGAYFRGWPCIQRRPKYGRNSTGEPAEDRQTTRILSFSFPAYLHRRRLPDVSDKICSVRQHGAASNDGNRVLPDWFLW